MLQTQMNEPAARFCGRIEAAKEVEFPGLFISHHILPFEHHSNSKKRLSGEARGLQTLVFSTEIECSIGGYSSFCALATIIGQSYVFGLKSTS
jgi:hypothetical protein